jgi:mono/diheme cytochrome c family protein
LKFVLLGVPIVAFGLVGLLVFRLLTGGSPTLGHTFVTFSPYEARQVKSLYMQNCASCHGTRGQGLPHQGTPLRGNDFIKVHSDQELVKFLADGRAANAPDSVMKIEMPPRGGNSALDDAQLRDLVGYVRFLQTEAGAQELR